ncbi:hypothetical protein KEM55_008977 [Ascosphaera atra]|nr:hypothetical protein KEM55_008977 [Ascosphaera atra]
MTTGNAFQYFGHFDGQFTPLVTNLEVPDPPEIPPKSPNRPKKTPPPRPPRSPVKEEDRRGRERPSHKRRTMPVRQEINEEVDEQAIATTTIVVGKDEVKAERFEVEIEKCAQVCPGTCPDEVSKMASSSRIYMMIVSLFDR